MRKNSVGRADGPSAAASLTIVLCWLIVTLLVAGYVVGGALVTVQSKPRKSCPFHGVGEYDKCYDLEVKQQPSLSPQPSSPRKLLKLACWLHATDPTRHVYFLLVRICPYLMQLQCLFYCMRMRAYTS